MTNRAIGGGPIELSGPDPVSEPALSVVAAEGSGVARAQPSYVPTGFAPLDGLLDRVDGLTGGKAGTLQHVGSYLVIGGFAALVNLICFQALLLPRTPLAKDVQWFVAYVIAAEISIMANFIPNDRYTFSRLPGHARSWWARCLRFHSTCIAGTLITLVISYTLYHWFGVWALLAEAVAILVALIFNFSFHHLWTYRHVGHTQQVGK